MSMMCDTVCNRCRRRYGWRGGPKDQPPCPSCAFLPDADVLAGAQAEVEAFRELPSRRAEGR